MGVYIKGMEMPKKGSWVTLRVFPDGQCFLYSWCGNDFDFMEHLTAFSVPPHGRLGDLDALRKDWLENGENEYVYDTNAFLDSLDDTPTIIPAEEGET